MTDNIVISSGHGKYIRGASGVLDEVDEARMVVEKVAGILLQHGVGVVTFHDDISETQQDNLEAIVDFHNSQKRDLDVSVHFNAYEDTEKPMGTECLYSTQSALAERVSGAVADAGDLFDRGPKYRSDLYFLNNTEMPAILIETCFVDSTADAECYRDKFDEICEAIAEAIGNTNGDELEEPDEPERPERPTIPPVSPPTLTDENRVDIIGATRGDVAIYINSQLVTGRPHSPGVVVLNITMTGDVVLSINGQDFHNKTSIPENQTEITASVFGGESDYNTSAYDEDVVLNDSDLYVALPDRFEGDRPAVRIINRVTGITADASIEDVGPWNTDDPYWETATRPQAESGTDMTGRKTNGAGIDLSPALARALGIDGMGKVDWDFIDEE
jgi:N-acetylmuramoyl-L-alanine amidase